MFGFSDYAEYRRNEQARVAREQKDTARRQAERRATERTARTKRANAVRPRVA